MSRTRRKCLPENTGSDFLTRSSGITEKDARERSKVAPVAIRAACGHSIVDDMVPLDPNLLAYRLSKYAALEIMTCFHITFFGKLKSIVSSGLRPGGEVGARMVAFFTPYAACDPEGQQVYEKENGEWVSMLIQRGSWYMVENAIGSKGFASRETLCERAKTVLNNLSRSQRASFGGAFGSSFVACRKALADSEKKSSRFPWSP